MEDHDDDKAGLYDDGASAEAIKRTGEVDLRSIEAAAARQDEDDLANGDAKTMVFEDVVLNAPIDPGTFAGEVTKARDLLCM